jgi:hypothetical protein
MKLRPPERGRERGQHKGTTMIICSKHEGNGTYREFKLDDAQSGDEVHVKTHLRHRADGDALSDDDWTDAGVIKRAGDTLEAAVLARRGKSAKVGLIKLDSRFTNEIAALQAIAVNYQPAKSLKN